MTFLRKITDEVTSNAQQMNSKECMTFHIIVREHMPKCNVPWSDVGRAQVLDYQIDVWKKDMNSMKNKLYHKHKKKPTTDTGGILYGL